MSNQKNVTTSLLIPVRNAETTIIALLESILSGSKFPDEIIIIDQSDNDNTKNAVDNYIEKRGIKINYNKSPRRGLCANRNDCIEKANNEFLIFIDQDMTVDKDWLKNIIEEWEMNWQKGMVVISGRTLPGEEFGPADLVPSIQIGTERKIYRDRPTTTEVLYGAYFGAPKNLFSSLLPKPFDERLGVGTKFPGADDTDFAYRVIKQKYPIVFEPQILAYHHPVPRSWKKMRYDYSFGYGAFICKHLLNGDLRMLLDFSKFLVVSSVKMIKSLVKFEEPEGSARFLSIIGASKGFFIWLFNSPKYK